MRAICSAVILMLVCAGAMLAQDTEKKNVVVGTWDCVAHSESDVPFTLVVTETDGKLAVVVKINEGDLEGQDAKIDGNKLTFTLTIENSPHTVEGTVDGDKIEGKYEGASASGTFQGKRQAT